MMRPEVEELINFGCDDPDNCQDLICQDERKRLRALIELGVRLAQSACVKVACVWCADGFEFVAGSNTMHKHPRSTQAEHCRSVRIRAITVASVLEASSREDRLAALGYEPVSEYQKDPFVRKETSR